MLYVIIQNISHVATSSFKGLGEMWFLAGQPVLSRPLLLKEGGMNIGEELALSGSRRL